MIPDCPYIKPIPKCWVGDPDSTWNTVFERFQLCMLFVCVSRKGKWKTVLHNRTGKAENQQTSFLYGFLLFLTVKIIAYCSLSASSDTAIYRSWPRVGRRPVLAGDMGPHYLRWKSCYISVRKSVLFLSQASSCMPQRLIYLVFVHLGTYQTSTWGR